MTQHTGLPSMFLRDIYAGGANQVSPTKGGATDRSNDQEGACPSLSLTMRSGGQQKRRRIFCAFFV